MTVRFHPTDAPLRAEGTRAELIAKLRELARGWTHLGKDKRADAARDGAAQLDEGALTVRVGHTQYVVIDTE
jgi:hypothetical protein